MAKIGEMISTEEAAEIIKSIESANDGFWFPLTTVVFFFGIVIFLLLRIYGTSQKASNKRHEENENLISGLVESKHTNDLILLELKMITTNHEQEIKKLTA
tara:strand:+ start:405 stop:707 length:303 start_codon:yes stop_codon:yes gene_type:complete